MEGQIVLDRLITKDYIIEVKDINLNRGLMMNYDERVQEIQIEAQRHNIAFYAKQLDSLLQQYGKGVRELYLLNH